ncbi:unnamed protein product [Spirodela intermedia]|uniref:Uncharacterized protein n=1 Tax=Spirodela intermedia TaxID=51605 RepID=A0A7I8J1G4_SPIIN|nr:unnamed protein product [Spirodela intermedia]CAA6664064.1 unnamed protein product [Spirodela intermedia]
MIPEIRRTCLYLPAARAIWKNLYQTYSRARDETERDRTYEYLVRLNSEYDQVRIQILGREKLPPLNEVISLVRGEESRRNLMLGSQNVENLTFMA